MRASAPTPSDSTCATAGADPARLKRCDFLRGAGTLNTLATNLGYGRSWGGIHWRSDATASVVIGEQFAISMLREVQMTIRESLDGFSFTRFDGNRIPV